MRRMTRFEYDNTVRDLLNDKTQPAADFPAEEQDANVGFNNTASLLVVDEGLAEQYMKAAEGISARAASDAGRFTGCVGKEQNLACATKWIEGFGKRAFRRPLDADERAMLLGVFQDGVTQGGPGEAGFQQGIEMVIETALQSPEFLYRVEILGTVDPSLKGVDPTRPIVRLSPYEMASRLSYLIWASMPDDELIAKADAGGLQTKDDIAAEARRMLADPKARAMVDEFHLEWLHYDRTANIAKDPAQFPDWSANVGALMQEESRQFVDHAVFDDAGDLKTLLTAPYTYMNDDLAKFYQQTPPGSGSSFSRVDLDPSKHAGVLTLGAIMSIYAHTNQTSPVHRGKLVRERFLCGVLRPPPNNFQAPDPAPNSTTRQRLEQHRADPNCAACHQLMDPIGFGFENFDAVGRYRTTDGGQPVDATGELIQSDENGTFDGAIQLANKLSQSKLVEQCYALQWFRFGYGRAEAADDACTIQTLDQGFASSNGDIKELIVSLTQSDAFLYRIADPGAQ
jgi:hypothetical protein